MTCNVDGQKPSSTSLCQQPRTRHVLKPHRGLLTLYAGAVEPQRRDAVRVALDVEDALVVPLSGLRLGQVLSQQRDRPQDSGGHVDLGGGQDLGAFLGGEKTHGEKELRRTAEALQDFWYAR